LIDSIVSLEFHKTRPRWRFPKSRFVEYDEDDEQHAVAQGWSGYGGERYDQKVSYVFPRCLINSVEPDGTVKFTALPEVGNSEYR
jgi:hypothetical protein